MDLFLVPSHTTLACPHLQKRAELGPSCVIEHSAPPNQGAEQVLNSWCPSLTSVRSLSRYRGVGRPRFGTFGIVFTALMRPVSFSTHSRTTPKEPAPMTRPTRYFSVKLRGKPKTQVHCKDTKDRW